jgi:hypothetical protein
LQSQAVEVHELYAKVEGNEKSVVRVVRWMLDEGKVELNNLNQLKLKME